MCVQFGGTLYFVVADENHVCLTGRNHRVSYACSDSWFPSGPLGGCAALAAEQEWDIVAAGFSVPPNCIPSLLMTPVTKNTKAKSQEEQNKKHLEYDGKVSQNQRGQKSSWKEGVGPRLLKY